MDPINTRPIDTRPIDDTRTEETSFGGRDDGKSDEDLRNRLSNLSHDDEVVSSQSLLQVKETNRDKAEVLIKKVYDKPDFNKKFVGKDENDFVWVSLKVINSKKFFMTDDGIQGKPSKSLLDFLGKKKIDIVSEDISKVTEDISKKSNEEENIRRNQKESQNKIITLEKQLRNAEERLDEYKKLTISLNSDISEIVGNNQERLDNIKKIRDQQENIDDLKKELEEENNVAFNELGEKLGIIQKELYEKREELERLNVEHEVLTEKLTLRQKIKQIFKEHGLTIFSITASVGTIIAAIVLNLTSGLSKIIKGVGNGVKALAKKLAQILPGMVGAIASFIFKTAGSVLGFLAKNSWLLILFLVTLAVEQYTKGRRLPKKK